MQAWSLGAPERGASREDLAANLPLIGRSDEIEALRGALTRAWAGQVTLVEVVGEPGIGKSRMLRQLHEEAGGCERSACHVRGLHELDDVRGVAGAAARAARAWGGRTPIASRDRQRHRRAAATSSRPAALAAVDRAPVRRGDADQHPRGGRARRDEPAREAARGHDVAARAAASRAYAGGDRGRPPHGRGVG